MPRASSPPGAGLRKVRRRKSSGYANPREQAMYGGSRKSRVVKAAKVETNLRQGRRTAAVEQFKRTRKPGSTATLSVKQEATALRTLSRRASTPQEWKQLQVDSPTGKALPGLETKIKDRRNQEIFAALPQPVQGALKAEADAQLATRVYKYAKTLPDFPKPKLQHLRKVAFNKRQNAQGIKLRLAEGGADINAKSPLIGLDKKGNINRIGPDPRLDGNSIENIIGDLIPDQPWEIALAAGTRGAFTVGSSAARAGAEAVGNILPKAGRVARAASRVRRVRGAVRGGLTAAAENMGSRTGASAARAAARAGADRVTAQVPKAVRSGARAGAKAATYPVRNPGKTTLAASGANVYSQLAGGTPVKTAALTPQKGVFTAVTTPAVKVAPGKIAENFLKDLVDLPVNMIPSLFLAGKASVQAVNGNDAALNAMVEDYIKTGFLPNAVKGDWAGAGEAFVNHPLYVALGASGGYAFIGRGLREAIHVPGAVLEHIPTKVTQKAGRRLYKIASDQRPDLKLNLSGMETKQKYSKNLITKGIQKGMERGLEKRGKDPFYAEHRPGIGSFKVGMGGIGIEKRKTLRGAMATAGQEGARRIDTQQAPLPLYKENRSFLQRWARAFNRNSGIEIPKSIRGAAVLFVNGMVRDAARARDDLAKLEAMWEDAYQADQAAKNAAPPAERTKTGWNTNQIRANRDLVKAARKARETATDEEIAQMFAVKERYLQAGGEQQAAAKRGNIFNDKQVRTATARPYAVAHMGGRSITKWKLYGVKKLFATKEDAKAYAEERSLKQSPRPVESFVDASGKKLPLKAVEDQMAKDKVTAGFVTERPNFKGARGNWYQVASLRRGRVDAHGKTRTGKASRGGLFDATDQTLAEQLVAATNVLNRAEAVDAINRSFLGKDMNTGKVVLVNSWDEAEAVMNDPEAYGLDPNESWRATNISKTRGGKDTVLQDEAWRLLNTPTRFDALSDSPSKIMSEQIRRSQDSSIPGKIAFIPNAVFSAVEALATPQGTVEKFFSAWSNLFKGIILPLSPKWIVGNVIDPTVRSILAGLHPLYWIVAHNMYKQLAEDNPRLRKEIDLPLAGGSMFGVALTQRVKRLDPEMFNDAISVARWARIWGRTENAPVIKQVGDAYAWYRDQMFNLNSKAFEQPWQKAVVGKEGYRNLRNMGYTLRDAMKPGSQAYVDLAKGMTSSSAQFAYAEEVWKVFGRWNTLTRAEKDWLTYAMPFGLWVKAAFQFVAITIPRHHPIKAAIGAQIAQMTEDERKQLGLSLFSENPVQYYNMGSIPLSRDQWYRPQFASSFGMFADPTNIIANNFFSQYSGIIAGLAGLDWKGDKLVSTGKFGNEEGRPLQPWEMALLATANLFEVSVPLVLQVGRLSDFSLPGQIAKPYWEDSKTKTNFKKDRLYPFLGLSTMNKSDIANQKKYFDSVTIQVPRSGSGSSSSGGSTPSWWYK